VIVARRIGALDDPKLFRAWLFRIASREAFRHLRKRRLFADRHEAVGQLAALPMPEVRPSGERLPELLATDSISPASRAVLLLHFEEELSLPQISASSRRWPFYSRRSRT
jgi:RNA polymerase sigma-70 factor (ECF subfamily)